MGIEKIEIIRLIKNWEIRIFEKNEIIWKWKWFDWTRKN